MTSDECCQPARTLTKAKLPHQWKSWSYYPFQGKKPGILIPRHKTVMITRHLIPSCNSRIRQPNLSPFLNKKKKNKLDTTAVFRVQTRIIKYNEASACHTTRSDSLQRPYIFPKGNMTGILKPFIQLKGVFGLQAGKWQSLYSLFMTQRFTLEHNTAIL